MRLPGFLEAQFPVALLLCEAVQPVRLASWRGVRPGVPACVACVRAHWLLLRLSSYAFFKSYNLNRALLRRALFCSCLAYARALCTRAGVGVGAGTVLIVGTAPSVRASLCGVGAGVVVACRRVGGRRPCVGVPCRHCLWRSFHLCSRGRARVGVGYACAGRVASCRADLLSPILNRQSVFLPECKLFLTARSLDFTGFFAVWRHYLQIFLKKCLTFVWAQSYASTNKTSTVITRLANRKEKCL